MLQFIEQAWNGISNTLLSGWDSSIGTPGIAATVLAAVWFFVRVIRKVVGILFTLCIAYLVLKVCFDIDISPWLQPLLKEISAL